MPTRTERLICAVLFGAYLVVNVILLFAVSPILWGEPARDVAVVVAAPVLGFPLLATAAGLKPQ